MAEDDLETLVQNIKAAFSHAKSELEENLEHCKTSFYGGEEASKIHSAFEQIVECQSDLHRILHDMEQVLTAEETEDFTRVYEAVRKQVLETAKEVDSKAAEMLDRMQSEAS